MGLLSGDLDDASDAQIQRLMGSVARAQVDQVGREGGDAPKIRIGSPRAYKHRFEPKDRELDLEGLIMVGVPLSVMTVIKDIASDEGLDPEMVIRAALRDYVLDKGYAGFEARFSVAIKAELESANDRFTRRFGLE